MKMQLLFTCFVYSIFISMCAVRAQPVKIGAIFFNDEVELLTAFDIAVHDINVLEQDVRLETVKHFVNEDDSIILQNMACSMIDSGVAAIFGPSSKAKSDIVEVICNATGIPHLQFDWHDEETLQHRLNHQMTLNLAPLQRNISDAYADILRTPPFAWSSFTIVYEKNSNLNLMQHLFAFKEFYKNGVRLKAFSRGDDYRILWKYVSNSREKYVVLECPPDILTDVMNASIFYNMTGPFNHLFLTNLDTHHSGVYSLYSQQFTVSIAAVRLRIYVPPQLHYEMDVFEDIEEEKVKTLRSQLLYDAVVLFYNAIRNMIRRVGFFQPDVKCGGGYWDAGPYVLTEMKALTYRNVTPPFKTQKVQFNEFGERDDFNLDIYNPMIDRVTHVWNIKQKLVDYDKLSENATKLTERRKIEDKKDYSQGRQRYKIATRIGEPYFMWRPEPEGVHYEGNERFEGYAVDLIYKLADECDFDFDFEPVSDNAYGSRDPVTEEWNGIIRQLIDHNAQMGICDLTVTQTRREVVDFTVPFMQLGISILYYKPPPPPANLFGFLKPFSLKVWIYLLVCLLIISLVQVLNARLSHAEWTYTSETKDGEKVVENVWKIDNTLWLSLGAILNQGCDILPRALPMRLFTTFWWIFALLMSQTYIAKLASFITASKMEGSIKSLHDLVDQNKVQFGTLKGGSTSVFFSESNETDYRKAWNKMIAMKPEAFTKNNQEGVDRVKRSKGRYAFLIETTSLQYSLLNNPELVQLGEPFGEKHYGIAVPLNADYRTNLSVGILKLSERGVLYTLKSKWFTGNSTIRSGVSSTGDNKPYGMDALGGLFLVLGLGLAAAFVIGIAEFLWQSKRISIREQVPYSRVLHSELAFIFRFWVQHKPLRTYASSRGSTSTGYSSCDRTPSKTESGSKNKKKNRNKKNEKKNS